MAFISKVLSVLIIIGMFTGLYNPRVKPFVPAPVTLPAYEGETITLIGGGASDYGILRGGSPAEITAADKLQGFLKEISGVELPIGGAPAKKITIGIDGALAPEGFTIRTRGADIAITGGGPRGVLYGVYDFLEKFLGCRWYNKENRYIPTLATVAVPAAIDVKKSPAFEYRAPTTVNRGYDIDSALANRVNAGWAVWDLNTPEYGGHSGYVVDHSGEKIMPGSTFETHPEYFALGEDGQRIGGYSNPCFSNPDVFALYKEYILAELAENPDLECICVALNDSSAVCQCADCKQAYWEECGVPVDSVSENCSGSHFRFLNRLCEAVTPLYPGVKISTFAYGVTQQPPKTKLHPSAVIYFCPIGMCYAHRAGECTQEETRVTFDRDYKTWLEKCGNIAVFDYPLNYNHWGVANPLWGTIQSYLQMYHNDGGVGLINCSSATDDIGFYAMTGYLYARLLWNPDADMEDLYNDFLPYYYGAGWQYIREYIRITSEELTGRTIGKVTYHTNCLTGSTPIGNLCMTNHQLKYIDALWAKAKELTAAAGQEQQLLNMRRAELSWRMWKSDSFRGECWPLRIPPTRRKSNTALFYDILSLGITQHSEGGLYVSAEDFEKLSLNLFNSQYWSWRQLGRSKEGKLDNVWQLLWSWVVPGKYS